MKIIVLLLLSVVLNPNAFAASAGFENPTIVCDFTFLNRGYVVDPIVASVGSSQPCYGPYCGPISYQYAGRNQIVSFGSNSAQTPAGPFDAITFYVLYSRPGIYRTVLLRELAAGYETEFDVQSYGARVRMTCAKKAG